MFLTDSGSRMTCTIIKTGNLCTIALSQSLWQAYGNSGILLIVCINIPGDYLAKFKGLRKETEKKYNCTMGVCSVTVQMNIHYLKNTQKDSMGQSILCDFPRTREPSSLYSS